MSKDKTSSLIIFNIFSKRTFLFFFFFFFTHFHSRKSTSAHPSWDFVKFLVLFGKHEQKSLHKIFTPRAKKFQPAFGIALLSQYILG